MILKKNKSEDNKKACKITQLTYVFVFEQLEETVYSMVMRYGLRLLKLRVLNAELKFIIRYVWASTWENLSSGFAQSDQHFVIHVLESIIF